MTTKPGHRTSRSNVSGTSISELLKNRAAASPGAAAFMTKRSGQWQTTTWQQVYERAADLAHGLLACGLAVGDRVAIIGNTREEWSYSDFALILAGGVAVPIYPSNPKDICAFILQDSQTAWIFVESEKQLGKLLELRSALPHVKQVFLWEGNVEGQPAAAGWVTTLHDLEARGRARRIDHPNQLAEIRQQLSGDTTATIIYTSGTTGNPKGVVVANDAFTIGGAYVQSAVQLDSSDRQVLFLPLSHSFAKSIEIAAVQVGFCTAFAESIDKIADNCAEVQPTFVCAVPRIFEKVYAKVVNGAKAGGPVAWAVFSSALRVGMQVSRERQAGREPSGLLALKYAVADKLVFGKLRQRFGGQLRFFVSGSAPLSKELAEFFHAAGLLILEGYGLTETNSMTSVNRIDRYKFGTVGPVLHPEIQVRIAADGEILTKGVTNLRRYYNQAEATKEAIDDDGWFHTGDIGELDEDGFLKITDRKKDLIKTSGGKYVAPQMIEGQLKLDPIISQAVVIGDQRKYVTTLLALNIEVARKVLVDSGHPTTDQHADILSSKAVEQRIQDKLNELNRKLGSWEQVKYFRLLPRELSESEGELTPTLKVKRKVVAERYRALIESMYQEQGGAGGGD